MSQESNKSENLPTVETQISAVTVYTTQALVTRRGTVELTGTERELIIAGLPLSIQTDSVRAGGEGTVGVKLLGVRTERKVFTEPVSHKVADLTDQIRGLDERRRTISDQIESLKLRRDFVQNMSDKAVDRFSQSLARQQISLEQTGELINFLGQNFTDFARDIAGLEREQAEIVRQTEALKRQLELLRYPPSKENYSLVVALEPAGAGNFELEVSYMVNAASWTPLYDLRVSNGANNLNLSYLAEVRQSSGEDWSGVGLTLSTAKPGLGSLPPKLDPWYIDMLRPLPPPAPMVGGAMRPMSVAAPRMAKMNDEFDTVAFAMEAAPQAAPVFQAQNVAAEVSNEGGVVTFRLDRDSDIPSDGEPHKTTIFSDDYPCKLEYVAVPRLVSFAYLQASVTNPAGGVTLLPGQANIFQNNVFVGKTRLENIAPGQEFKLSLGIDEGLKIERDLTGREVDKRFIGGQRRITYGYRLTVTNLRDQEASLKLSEQLPVSRNEQIKVKLTRSTPPIQLGELAVLEWAVTLPPKAKREFSYEFTVEHPTEMTVTGLNV